MQFKNLILSLKILDNVQVSRSKIFCEVNALAGYVFNGQTIRLERYIQFVFQAGRVSNFHTTPAASIDQKWRKANRLGRNPTSEGVLVHAPDYSFVDGRETPISVSYFLDSHSHLSHAPEYSFSCPFLLVQPVGEIEKAETVCHTSCGNDC
jgi:Mitoribosomal protein mL52